MYKKLTRRKTTIAINKSTEGERLELKVARITQQKEPIKDAVSQIYSSREEGVLPEYNIRNDKWETAVDGMAKVKDIHQGKRKKDDQKPEAGENKGASGASGPAETGASETTT